MAVTRYTRDMVGRSQRGDVFVLETEYMKLCADNARMTADLAGNGVLIAEQNKLLAERQEWALHTSEIIRGLNAELADRASPEMVFTLKATIRQLTDELAELSEWSRDDLNTMRQWFDSVQDTNNGYLEPNDYALAIRVYQAVGMRVPSSVTNGAMQKGDQ